MGCLLISYTIAGAFAFQYLETLEPVNIIVEVSQENVFFLLLLISSGKVTETRNSTVINLWNTTDIYNTLNPKLWQNKTNEILQEYQQHIIRKVKEGYDTRTVECTQKFIFMWC